MEEGLGVHAGAIKHVGGDEPSFCGFFESMEDSVEIVETEATAADIASRKRTEKTRRSKRVGVWQYQWYQYQYRDIDPKEDKGRK